jgi:hypothetical protein
MQRRLSGGDVRALAGELARQPDDPLHRDRVRLDLGADTDRADAVNLGDANRGGAVGVKIIDRGFGGRDLAGRAWPATTSTSVIAMRKHPRKRWQAG